MALLKSHLAENIGSGPPVGSFPQFPSEATILAFREHVERTGEPESFPGICVTKPPDGASFEILDMEFRINPLKRADGQMAPCPICSPKAPKYLLGVFTWYPAEGVIRAIGHECGSAADKYQRSEAERRSAARLQHRQMTRRLQASLPQVRNLIAECSKMTRAAEHAESLSLNLRRRARTFCHRVIDETNQNGGQLTVVEEFEGANGRRESARKTVGAPRGTDFLRSMYKPNAHRLNALRILQYCDKGFEQESLNWLVENADNYSALDEIDANLTKALKEVDLMRAQTPKAAEFLGASNLELIDRWGRQVPIPPLKAARIGQRVLIRGPSLTGNGNEAWLDPDFDRLQVRN